MKIGINYLILATLLLNSCEKSQEKPTQLEKLVQTSRPNGVVPCFHNKNNKSNFDYVEFNKQKVLFSRNQDNLIVHGYIIPGREKCKDPTSLTEYTEVQIILNKNAKAEIEKSLREKDYKGEISFWQ